MKFVILFLFVSSLYSEVIHLSNGKQMDKNNFCLGYKENIKALNNFDLSKIFNSPYLMKDYIFQKRKKQDLQIHFNMDYNKFCRSKYIKQKK